MIRNRNLGDRVDTVYGILHPDMASTLYGSAQWFRRALAAQGLKVSERSIYNWLRCGPPDEHRQVVEAVLLELALTAADALKGQMTRLEAVL